MLELDVERIPNMVAHTLAKHAMRYHECVVQRFECPEWVRSIVENEAQNLCTSESSRRRHEGLPDNCNTVCKLMKVSIPRFLLLHICFKIFIIV
jgi:hypothetical protein